MNTLYPFRMVYWIFLLAFFAFPIFSSAQLTLQDSLVAIYPMDGDALDYSGNLNHGTVFGATLTTDRFGNPNSAYFFDGIDDYIEYTSANKFRPTLPITVSAWIQLNDHHRNMVFANNWEVGSYHGVFMGNSTVGGQKFYVQYGDGGGVGPSSRRTKEGTTNLSIGTWYHVAVIVRGPQDMEIYINGKNDCGSYDGFGGAMTYLAHAPGQSGISDPFGSVPFLDYYHGKIDDLRFWRRELTEQEIASMQDNPVGTVSTDTTICLGDTIQLFGGEADTYAWFPNTGLSCNTCATPLASPMVNTTYVLTTSNGFGCNTTSSLTVNVDSCVELTCDSLGLAAGFDWQVQGLSVQLQDTSIGNIDSIQWDLGDGNFLVLGPGQSYIHQYTQADSYEICLTIFGDLSPDSACSISTCQWVSVASSCDDFNLQSSFISVSTGVQVNLTDQSGGTIDSLVWEMGNGDVVQGVPGGSSSYTYPQPGTYTVCQKIFGFLPDSLCVDSQCITVIAKRAFDCDSAGLAADFSFNPQGLSYIFSDLSAGNADQVYWSYGDGSGAYDQPGDTSLHTYLTSGTYQVCLTLTDSLDEETIYLRYLFKSKQSAVTGRDKGFAYRPGFFSELSIAVIVIYMTL